MRLISFLLALSASLIGCLSESDSHPNAIDENESEVIKHCVINNTSAEDVAECLYHAENPI